MPLDDQKIAEMRRNLVEEMRREVKTGDHLSPFDRDILGRESVRILIPLRDTTMLKVHLAMLRETVEACETALSYRRADERGALFEIAGRLREVAGKINCYKRMRPR